jgi:hypothetical protein
MSIQGSAETSCRMSASGNSGASRSGVIGSSVPGGAERLRHAGEVRHDVQPRRRQVVVAEIEAGALGHRVLLEVCKGGAEA